MATAREYIFNIQNLHSRFIQSDDNKLSDKQVLFIMNYYRAKLIRQDVEKGRPISPFLIQDWYSNVFCVDTAEPYVIGDKILKTDTKLPKVVEGRMDDYITYVGRVDRRGRFDKINFSSLDSIKHTKHSKNFPKWYIENYSVYISNPPTDNLKTILVRGVFEQPELLVIKEPFKLYDWEYPISSNMMDTIIKLLVQSEFKLAFSLPEDKLNDGSQD